MQKHLIYSVTGLALLTTFALPQVAMAGNDKAPDKTSVTETAATKKAQLLQQQGADAKPGVAGTSGMKGEAGLAGSPTEVRNWAAIDTNKDHSIQPEEMEKYLTDSWAGQKKAAPRAK
ncbi:MAG: hypothetical protein WCC58_10660 [Burkholderiales bacterium]